MRSVSHREMRNEIGRILRAVAAGESVLVTNNGAGGRSDFAASG
jgi:prevent-host-death family protein